MAPDHGIYIGLMSGTSLDGVDALAADFSDPASGLKILGTCYRPFPEELKRALESLQSPASGELDQAALASVDLAELYAHCVHELLAGSGIATHAVRAIGCHGQTVRHAPSRGYTLQLNQPALLAERTGITVVADFRSRDIAAGGQGAPLVPAFHQALFSHPRHSRVVVNIGGIANVTWLPPRGNDAPVTGFDTGPGNVLMDIWMQRHRNQPYDSDGEWAASGKQQAELLAGMLAEPYFQARPPKSTGRDLFNEAWLRDRGLENHAPVDVQATLAALTVTSIATALRRYCPPFAELYVCGGGARNRWLMDLLERELPGTPVTDTAAVGLDPDWVEAAAFAWLARQAVGGRPGNLPAVTGALGPRILGAIYPA